MPITIKVALNGPLQIAGDDVPEIRLVDHEGNEIPIPPGKPRLSLCRCGASTRKPFCDGTHSRIGFNAAEAAQRAADAEQQKPQG